MISTWYYWCVDPRCVLCREKNGLFSYEIHPTQQLSTFLRSHWFYNFFWRIGQLKPSPVWFHYSLFVLIAELVFKQAKLGLWIHLLCWLSNPNFSQKSQSLFLTVLKVLGCYIIKCLVGHTKVILPPIERKFIFQIVHNSTLLIYSILFIIILIANLKFSPYLVSLSSRQ